jgi:hypothetical protein
MENYFVLNEHGEPQVEPDVNVWLRWFEQADRNIARTSVDTDVVVSPRFAASMRLPRLVTRRGCSKRACSAACWMAKSWSSRQETKRSSFMRGSLTGAALAPAPTLGSTRRC